jgi:hypothetical protein
MFRIASAILDHLCFRHRKIPGPLPLMAPYTAADAPLTGLLIAQECILDTAWPGLYKLL